MLFHGDCLRPSQRWRRIWLLWSKKKRRNTNHWTRLDCECYRGYRLGEACLSVCPSVVIACHSIGFYIGRKADSHPNSWGGHSEFIRTESWLRRYICQALLDASMTLASCNDSVFQLIPSRAAAAVQLKPRPNTDPPNYAPNVWRCQYCTYDNDVALDECNVCHFKRGTKPNTF